MKLQALLCQCWLVETKGVWSVRNLCHLSTIHSLPEQVE